MYTIGYADTSKFQWDQGGKWVDFDWKADAELWKAWKAGSEHLKMIVMGKKYHFDKAVISARIMFFPRIITIKVSHLWRAHMNFKKKFESNLMKSLMKKESI